MVKKALVVQYNMRPVGGGNAVAAWMMEALKDEYALSVLTWEPVDFGAVDSYFGTSLRLADLPAYHFPSWIRGLCALDPHLYSIQGLSVMMRLCKIIGDKFDVIISAADEIDFGRRTIQYTHYPYLAHVYRTVTAPPDASHRMRMAAFLRRCRPWRVISGFSFERMKRNLILVNSNWTAARLRESYGVEPKTIYPPVCWQLPQTHWDSRENGFVCIGRISGDKRLVELIQIMNSVRARGHNVHLHIIGTPWDVREGHQYYRMIKKIAEKYSAWVQLHESLPRSQMEALVSQHRYGLHCKTDEHFGIAVAEMVRAGCIVFAPRSGGQVEIVGNEDRLLYGSYEEAVEKIEHVIGSELEQLELRGILAARQELFSTARFMTEILNTVRSFEKGM